MSKEIFYFGFGGICSPGLRELRGIETIMTAPAVLNDYRLTFAVAGAPNIIEKRGWEVHGVLMQLSQKDWDILKEKEAGYDYTLVDVWTYGDQTRCYRARAFIMNANNLKNEELPSDRLPQERFLRIIASGMRHHGVDEDYIENEVMNCPYIPSRKPEEYLRFPSVEDDDHPSLRVKTIPVQKYLKQASKKKWFAIGDRVFCIRSEIEEDHPFVMWLRSSFIGHLDVTWTVSRSLFDPDLPRCASNDELTEEHHTWCENMLVDYFSQADISDVMMIGRLSKDNETSSSSGRRGSSKNVRQLMSSCTALMKKIKHRKSITGSNELDSSRSSKSRIKSREPAPVKLFSDRTQRTEEVDPTCSSDNL